MSVQIKVMTSCKSREPNAIVKIAEHDHIAKTIEQGDVRNNRTIIRRPVNLKDVPVSRSAAISLLKKQPQRMRTDDLHGRLLSETYVGSD